MGSWDFRGSYKPEKSEETLDAETKEPKGASGGAEPKESEILSLKPSLRFGLMIASCEGHVGVGSSESNTRFTVLQKPLSFGDEGLIDGLCILVLQVLVFISWAQL
ncbi:hypothetical protein ACFX13_008653 [Malus domestica]